MLGTKKNLKCHLCGADGHIQVMCSMNPKSPIYRGEGGVGEIP